MHCSMGGPPIVVYLLAVTDDNNEYLATAQTYFCFSSVYATFTRYLHGMIVPEMGPFFLLGLPLVLLGLFVGIKLFNKVDAQKLRKIIYIFMAISGAVMVIK